MGEKNDVPGIVAAHFNGEPLRLGNGLVELSGLQLEVLVEQRSLGLDVGKRAGWITASGHCGPIGGKLQGRHDGITLRHSVVAHGIDPRQRTDGR